MSLSSECEISSFLFSFFTQTVEHGFPNQPSALAYDPKLQLMAIGTKSGAIKLYPFVSALLKWNQWYRFFFFLLYTDYHLRFKKKKKKKCTLFNKNALHWSKVDSKYFHIVIFIFYFFTFLYSILKNNAWFHKNSRQHNFSM